MIYTVVKWLYYDEGNNYYFVKAADNKYYIGCSELLFNSKERFISKHWTYVWSLDLLCKDLQEDPSSKDPFLLALKKLDLIALL